MRPKHTQRGAALVEFALVSGLLLLLLFGIVELGLLLGDQALVGAAAREGVRSAAVGDPTATAQSRAVSGGSGLPMMSGNVVLEKSTDGITWTTLGNSGSNNNAVTGNFVRATVTYAHPLVTAYIFAGTTKTLTAKLVMRRE